MAAQRKLVATALVSFFAGAAVIGSFGYAGFNQHLREGFISSFNAHAAEAQFDVRTLVRLRAGDTQKAVRDFETFLDGHTMQLAEYEAVVPSERRDPLVYRALAEVRAYRAQSPAHFEYPLQQAEYQKALDLGSKAGG